MLRPAEPEVITADAVWSLVDKRDHDECWPWLGGTRGQQKRGRITWRGRERYAYRVTWELANGIEFPDGLQARHSCDNPRCVNPAHITPGTHAQNMSDMVERGRWRLPMLSGDAHPHSLPRELVEAVRADYATGRFTKAEVAQRHGLNPHTVDKWTKGEVRGLTPIRRPEPECGTRAKVYVHRKRGEPVCDACKEADRAYMRAWKARRLRT
jgi:hypothetical protein